MPGIRRREFITLLGGAAAVWPVVARAQRGIPVVGFLGAEFASTNRHFFDAFRDGMREHGYIDGQNVYSCGAMGRGPKRAFS